MNAHGRFSIVLAVGLACLPAAVRARQSATRARRARRARPKT